MASLPRSWDEVGALGQRARQLWEEMERETAGYALRGFVAAAHVALARGESALAANFIDVVEAILREFEHSRSARGSVHNRWYPLLHFDRAGLEQITADWRLLKGIPDSPERLTSAMSDRHWTLPVDVTAPLLDWAVTEGLLPLEVQLRRAIGLRDSDESELVRAAQIAAAIGARSPLARLRYEVARIRADSSGMAAAIAALEAMGDHGQIRLYQG